MSKMSEFYIGIVEMVEQGLSYDSIITMMVDEGTFNLIQSGNTVERMTQEGLIRFDKYNFENEVAVTSVTVEYSTRKLGQRKQK